MSEHAPHTHEHQNFTPEIGPRHPEQQRRPEQTSEQHETPKEERAEAARDTIQHESKKAEPIAPAETGSADEPMLFVSRELHQETWHRTLTRVQKQLSAPSRAFSKIIHQPAVDAVSTVGSKTAARPSGLLGGGICAFIGSSFFLYMSRHYGFTYNYLLFFLFFVGGFAFGICLEMLFYAVHGRKAS